MEHTPRIKFVLYAKRDAINFALEHDLDLKSLKEELFDRREFLETSIKADNPEMRLACSPRIWADTYIEELGNIIRVLEFNL
jgi:hypothetical protein